MQVVRSPNLVCVLLSGVWMLGSALPSAALGAPATSLPSSIDAGRLGQRDGTQDGAPVRTLSDTKTPTSISYSSTAPKGSEKIKITLKEVRFDGMTAFADAQMADIYTPYLKQKIGLNMLWVMAGRMTERYQAAGYFLSRVVVPQQDVTSGKVTFHVVEGYIDTIDAPKDLLDHDIVQAWLARLKGYHPLKSAQMESILLQLNDLAGIQLHALLEPADDKAVAQAGGVKLKLENANTGGVHGRVQMDNYGSRYIGPYEASVQTEFSAIPLQRTTVTGLSAIPYSEMHYGGITHEIPVFPGGSLSVAANHTNSAPDYTLKSENVRSDATQFGAALDYQWIRQRDENLTLHLGTDARAVNTTILGVQQTRDEIRALRAGGNYEWQDDWAGANHVGMTLSQGLNVLGSSDAGDANLSRSGAKPDFTKLELSLRREQRLADAWGLTAATAMQAASGTLYVSEQFGYGGQAFGRAYDDSEITGDHGIDGSLELNYRGLPDWEGWQAVPYGYYDIGVVWNDSDTQVARAMGSSIGSGIRVQGINGVYGDLGVAFPLTRQISAPLDGNRDGPRAMLQIGYEF